MRVGLAKGNANAAALIETGDIPPRVGIFLHELRNILTYELAPVL